MRRYGPAVLLALVGAAILRVSLFSELYLRYVQAGLRPYLVVSGVGLVLLGGVVGVMVLRASGERDGHEEEGDGHSHGPAGPRVAWLLALPALALLLFPPPALGSYSAEREAAQRSAQGVGSFPALPSGNPLDLTLGEFGSRAVYDSSRSLKGRTLRLTGFVTRDGDGTWYVTRLLVSCCAADATTAKAEVRGAAAPPVDAWVTVTGTWHPQGQPGSDSAWPPVLDVTSVRRVPQPDNPYEKR
ncbi:MULTISPECIES: TIGR03943 family protein [Streptomyces]|uniref:TIGR03943 family protein n=1 Tax=Streptomyces koelreuteriae TaxID=2838015 RepID=A0ABX8G4B5_9ACTN|nr:MULTISPECIES: TIGR03943 family protein [Streptomyces]QWB28311.1 TIGR03943 family protein [Streptomyces koelreuteriae]UUA11361.1 TIGR03943 family protein [Streptomyces koelreuteriae]UUA18960.1 TIGR03943 family protein [Streptomyces sp. CRCS-T-1]